MHTVTIHFKLENIACMRLNYVRYFGVFKAICSFHNIITFDQLSKNH
jgi:hypothetical protein